MDDNKFLPNLSQNLLEILEDDEYYDVTIEVGSDPCVKIFCAHGNILNYRSPYLRNILSINKKEKDGTLTHIKLPNILPDIFQIILRYIYGGRLSFEGYDVTDVIKTLVAASELDLQELVNHLQFFLIKNNSTWMKNNFNMIYKTSFENDSLLELQNYCNYLITEKPDKIFKSLDFSSIPEKILISLIQNDNLKINEVQIWKHVLKWGLDQNPGLPSDSSSFSSDDFSVLKNTLQQCIPFIRFYNLTSKEFLENVFPYRKIIPEKLFMDLLKLFLDHDYKPTDQSEPEETKEIKPEAQTSEKIETESTNARTIPSIKPQIFNETRPTSIRVNEASSTNTIHINSNIITIEHARLISKWINRLAVNALYEFKLIHRGSRDGFDRNIFHNICDYQSSTVTVIKVKDSSEILGGYNPLEWKSNSSYGHTSDSFIFSFENNHSIKNYILSRVRKGNYAISNDSNRGPSFGKSDLVMRGNFYSNCCCIISSYERPIRKVMEKFSVDEYEVFQVTRI
ncbi:unnamed protein product [Rhizophagus irregularis]|nr:unnamed protein product [Rhizophagus irregularis]